MNAVKEAWKEITKSVTWTKKELPDLEGCTILVTGATDGVGYDSALAFAEHGAHVIVHGRDRAKGDHAVAEIKKTASPKAKVEYMQGDLSDFKEIRKFVKHYESTGYPLHVLLNNAALQAPKGQRGAKTVDGFEITVGVNFFGPLYLTELLLPIMKRSSAPKVITKRIVWVTSLGSQLANPPVIGEGSGWSGISVVPWDDLRCEHREESDWWQYARSKLFNLMAMREEARRLEADHIDVVGAHPGLAVTDHFGKADTEHKLSSWLVETFANSPMGLTSEQGAIALEYACASPDVNGKNGWYVGSPELGLVNVGNAHLRKNPQAPLVNDEEACRKLYNKSLAILKQCDPNFSPISGPIEPTYVTAT